MRQVFVATNPVQANIVKETLVASGIRAMVRGEALWTARGEVPMTGDTLPSVWVPEADYEAAVALLQETERYHAETLPAWQCPKCGQEVDGDFDECWSCGTVRGAESQE